MSRIFDTPSHTTNTWTMVFRKLFSLPARFSVNNEINVVLLVQPGLLALVLSHFSETQFIEQVF